METVIKDWLKDAKKRLNSKLASKRVREKEEVESTVDADDRIDLDKVPFA